MSATQQLLARITRSEPRGTVHVVDADPLNWPYNTVEELVRVTRGGKVRPAAMRSYRWVDATTLEVDVRTDERFPDGERLDAHAVKRAFDEQIRWVAPHPPGTHFNIDRRTRCEVGGEHRVRFHQPEPDGAVLGKLRATHVMSERFWRDLGFGYERDSSGRAIGE